MFSLSALATPVRCGGFWLSLNEESFFLSFSLKLRVSPAGQKSFHDVALFFLRVCDYNVSRFHLCVISGRDEEARSVADV